jgi:hypothetical protein
MTRTKYKLADKRGDQENWNINENEQKKNLIRIRILERLMDQLKDEMY